jgi:hypothetical protein
LFIFQVYLNIVHVLTGLLFTISASLVNNPKANLLEIHKQLSVVTVKNLFETLPCHKNTRFSLLHMNRVENSVFTFKKLQLHLTWLLSTLREVEKRFCAVFVSQRQEGNLIIPGNLFIRLGWMHWVLQGLWAMLVYHEVGNSIEIYLKLIQQFNQFIKHGSKRITQRYLKCVTVKNKALIVLNISVILSSCDEVEALF